MCDGELESWLAYYELEPFGPQAEWMQNALLRQAIRGGKLEEFILET